MTESVNCTLVPGDDTYPDKKGFTWELVGYDSDRIVIKFNFTYPLYISTGHKLDTIRIQIFNSEKLFPAPSGGKVSLPDNYTLIQIIPPQGIGLLSEIEVQ